jgi:hypothetical protein
VCILCDVCVCGVVYIMLDGVSGREATGGSRSAQGASTQRREGGGSGCRGGGIQSAPASRLWVLLIPRSGLEYVGVKSGLVVVAVGKRDAWRLHVQTPPRQKAGWRSSIGAALGQHFDCVETGLGPRSRLAGEKTKAPRGGGGLAMERTQAPAATRCIQTQSCACLRAGSLLLETTPRITQA